MSARIEVFGDKLATGDRVFTDGTVVRDVDALQLGFVTSADVEERRTEARTDNHTAALVRLAEIINGKTIQGRHRRLRKRDGTNRPPFMFWRNLIRDFREEQRLEANLRTPWWIGADRRDSYLALTYLEENGTPERLEELIVAGTVTPRRLIVLARKKYLRQEVRLRLRRVASREGLPSDEPVKTLADAVRHPDDWCRPRVHTMIVEAAAEGPEGALGALFPRVLDRRTLKMLFDLNLVSKGFYNALLGITEEDDKDGDNDAFRVDTGELNQVLTEGAARHARVGAGAG